MPTSASSLLCFLVLLVCSVDLHNTSKLSGNIWPLDDETNFDQLPVVQVPSAALIYCACCCSSISEVLTYEKFSA